MHPLQRPFWKLLMVSGRRAGYGTTLKLGLPRKVRKVVGEKDVTRSCVCDTSRSTPFWWSVATQYSGEHGFRVGPERVQWTATVGCCAHQAASELRTGINTEASLKYMINMCCYSPRIVCPSACMRNCGPSCDPYLYFDEFHHLLH
jgi:hypothetical protein